MINCCIYSVENELLENTLHSTLTIPIVNVLRHAIHDTPNTETPTI